MARHPWQAGSLLASALLVACGQAGGEAPSTGAADVAALDQTQAQPVVVVGGAQPDGTGFVDWSTGDARPAIVRGPQGGQHVYVSVRTAHLYPFQSKLEVTVSAPGGAQPYAPGPSTWKVSLKKDGEWLGYQGITAFVDDPCAVRDKPAQVHVQVTDSYGVVGSADATIVPTWDGACP